MGLTKVSYSHLWTHRWIAANLRLLGGEAILLLGICQQLVFLPIFFFTSSLTLSLLTSIELPALVVCGLSFLAIWLLSNVKYSTGNLDFFLVSESYAFSLAIFMAMLPVGRFWLFQSCQNHRWLTVHPLAIAAAVAAVLACGSIKISSGLILALFLVLCISIPKLWQKDSISWLNLGRLLILAAAFALGGLALALIFGYGLDNGSLLSTISIMGFVRTHPRYFIWLNQTFLVCIILIYFLNSKNGWLYQRSQVLMLTVLFLGSQIPGNLLDLYHGINAIYFFEPALLVILFFTVSAVADYWQIHREIGLPVTVMSVNHSWQPMSQKLLIWGLIFISIISISSIEVTLEKLAFTKSHISSFFDKTITVLDTSSTQSQFPQLTGLNKTKHQLGLLLTPPSQTEKLKQNTNLGAIQSHIRELSLSPNHAKPTAIYIAPDFVDFWHDHSEKCDISRAFSIPVMTGFPLLNGVCPGSRGSYYGLADYDSESWNRPLSDSDLCTKATRLGFAQVLKITDRSKYTLLTCPAKTASK